MFQASVPLTFINVPERNAGDSRLLRAAAAGWLVLALTGQMVFALYVAVFYGGAALAGAPERWNVVLPRGWDATEPLANGVLALHLSLAVVLLLAGAMQLVPALRRARPAVHRWTGRVYLSAASVLAIGGLGLVWLRGGAAGDLSQHLAISANALIILGCAGLAWRAARARSFEQHRRWALRVFVAASGVWFFRVGLMAWIGLHGAPVGFDPKSFSGPFLTVLAWAVYVVVPLLVLEAYLRARASGSAAAVLAVSALLGVVTAVMAFGIVVASIGMWGPRIY